MPMLKEKYGDKIGMGCGLVGVEMGSSPPREELLDKVRKTIDVFGKNGGLYLSLYGASNVETMWDMCCEAYCYSREFYDNERERA